MKVAPIVGVRPEIIKSAPLLHLLKNDPEIELELIYSGQHYDFEMSKIFFNELDLADPLHNLNIGSGSHAIQTARLMTRAEKAIRNLRPDIVMVFGDTNTTLAGALAAIKMRVAVCHVEAGLRSYDISMPEEINRVLTDHCSQMLCAPTSVAFKNLRNEGIYESNILLSGDTNYDAILQHKEDIKKSTIVKDLGLTEKIYAVLTLHRPENVDVSTRLRKIVSAMISLSEVTVVFPVHPRTKKNFRRSNLGSVLKKAPNLMLTEPLGYYDMLSLMKRSEVVLTDSGGIQKEAFLLYVPCVTLRYRTEWLETLELGANTLVGAETNKIIVETRRVLENGDVRKRLKTLPNPYGDGKASWKIVKDLKERFLSGKFSIESPTFFRGQ